MRLDFSDIIAAVSLAWSGFRYGMTPPTARID